MRCRLPQTAGSERSMARTSTSPANPSSWSWALAGAPTLSQRCAASPASAAASYSTVSALPLVCYHALAHARVTKPHTLLKCSSACTCAAGNGHSWCRSSTLTASMLSFSAPAITSSSRARPSHVLLSARPASRVQLHPSAVSASTQQCQQLHRSQASHVQANASVNRRWLSRVPEPPRTRCAPLPHPTRFPWPPHHYHAYPAPHCPSMHAPCEFQ